MQNAERPHPYPFPDTGRGVKNEIENAVLKVEDGKANYHYRDGTDEAGGETSYSEFKEVDGSRIVEDTIQGLISAGLLKEADRKDIVDTWVYDAKYSYPTPTMERDSILAEVIPFLEQHEIYSRGRFGMWKYEVSNADHSLMQGVELVYRLVLGEKETTIGMTYASTGDGRNAAVHERSTHAGSGEKKTIVSSLDQPGDRAESHISEEELGVVSTKEPQAKWRGLLRKKTGRP